LGGQARDRQRAKASEPAQDGELGDAQPRGRQSRIIGGGDRARGAAERDASARCLEIHSHVYTPFLWECKPTEPCSACGGAGKPKDRNESEPDTQTGSTASWWSSRPTNSRR